MKKHLENNDGHSGRPQEHSENTEQNMTDSRADLKQHMLSKQHKKQTTTDTPADLKRAQNTLKQLYNGHSG